MTVVCRSVTAHTARKLSEKEKHELKKVIKSFNLTVEEGKEVRYPFNKGEILVSFSRVYPSPCRIGSETDIQVLTEEEVIEKYGSRVASIGEMLKRAGCSLILKDKKSGEFYFCHGVVWNIKPYKGGVYMSKIDELKF